MARLILCADDYGLAPGVSRGIARLIAAGRLSATGCMTLTRHWPEQAPTLRPLAERADIGLHLTLTDLAPLGAMPVLAPQGRLPSLGKLLALSLLGRLPRKEIAAELERQLDAFEQAMGRPPVFLDGHKHIHQFPGVREVVIELWQRLRTTKAWLRVADEPGGGLKGAVIAFVGRGLRRRAAQAGIPLNDRFAGVYDLTDRVPYAQLFERFVSGTGAHERLLVMCQPGEVDDELRAVDPVTTAREAELRFLEGPDFLPMLQRHGLTLGRFD